MPDSPYWEESLTLDRLSSVDSDGGLGWETIRLEFQYDEGESDNGADDNGNGLVDEGRVVLTRAVGTAEENSVVLCRSVREYLEGEEPNGSDDNGNGLVDEKGFCFTLDGDLLMVRLTIERLNADKHLVSETTYSGIGFRN